MTLARRAWDYLFGPPRIRSLPDGAVQVRLLGRVFEAADHDGLFDAVGRERERLLAAMSKLHEGAAGRPQLGFSRLGTGDLYQRDLQRLQDRLAAYNAFLGHLMRHTRRPS